MFNHSDPNLGKIRNTSCGCDYPRKVSFEEHLSDGIATATREKCRINLTRKHSYCQFLEKDTVEIILRTFACSWKIASQSSKSLLADLPAALVAQRLLVWLPISRRIYSIKYLPILLNCWYFSDRIAIFLAAWPIFLAKLHIFRLMQSDEISQFFCVSANSLVPESSHLRFQRFPSSLPVSSYNISSLFWRDRPGRMTS